MSDIPAAAPSAAPAATATPASTPTATPATTAATETAPVASSVRDVTAAAIEMATRMERAEKLAEAGLPAEESAAATPAAAPATPDPKAAKPDDKAKDPKAEDDKGSPTARIATLAEENRKARGAIKALEAKITEVEGRSTTTAAEAKQLADVRAAFKKDPLEALKILGEEWRDIVDRVANGGVPPTPEQQAAADAKAAADARDARLKKLEDEREAEKTDAQRREEDAQTTGARNYVATKMITADAYPKLVGIAEEAAVEALAQVESALETAFKQGKRATRHPVDLDESMRLTHAALSGLNDFYVDLSVKLGGTPAAQQTAATTVVAPAATAAPAVSLIDQAKSQQRGPETLTPSVVARLPPAIQSRAMSADDARARAIEMAAQLPPL